MLKRMFVALDLPAPLTQALAGLDPQLAGVRWLPAAQLHLTLGFLAAVAAEHEQRLSAALAALRVAQFQLALRGLGSFTWNGRPSVVWVGIANPPPLLELQRRIHHAVLGAGLVPDPKPFQPHITVARCKGLAGQALRPLLERHQHSDFGTFEATGLTLYASILHLHGPEHVPVLQQGFDSP